MYDTYIKEPICETAPQWADHRKGVPPMSNDQEALTNSKEKEGLPTIAVQSINPTAPANGRRRRLEGDHHFTVKLSNSSTFRSRYFARNSRPGIHPLTLT